MVSSTPSPDPPIGNDCTCTTAPSRPPITALCSSPFAPRTNYCSICVVSSWGSSANAVVLALLPFRSVAHDAERGVAQAAPPAAIALVLTVHIRGDRRADQDQQHEGKRLIRNGNFDA